VIRVARQCLNRANASRIISKQESMVELTNLPLVISSEDIENVNISGAMKITTKYYNDKTSTLISRYQKRDSTLEKYSLCEFFHKEHNKNIKNAKNVVPHFVGMSSTPTYPVTASYARATLIIHKPWREPMFHMLTDNECIDIFEKCLFENYFPRSVKLAYQKEKRRFLENKTNLEPLQQKECYDNDEHAMSQEETELVELMTSITSNLKQSVSIRGLDYDRGLTYDWSQRLPQVSESNEYTVMPKNNVNCFVN
jgi:hypothetical protein